MLLLSYIREEEGRSEVLKGYEEEISRSNTPAFHWPPKPPSEEEERVALAAPIYVAPPETQHVQPKPRSEQGQMLPPSAHANNEQNTCTTQLIQKTFDVSEQPEMYSDTSASTTTGDSSSEEYQVYSTNVSQQIVRYYDEPKPNPINAAMNFASNYATMLKHKPSICSVDLNSYIDDNNYDNGKLQEIEEAYLVREPSEQHMVYSQEPDESQRKIKRVVFTMPPQEGAEYREDSMSCEIRRQSPRSVEGRHGPLYPNSLQIQHEFDLYYDQRRKSGQSYEEDMDRRQSCDSYDDSRRESQITDFEDKTLSFTNQYCTGDTKFSLLKLEDTKPNPLPSSPNVNSLPQQWQSQMLKALTTTPKEVEKDMDDSFERARQEAYEKQIEDDRKARENERKKLMDEMLAKQRAMRERQERNEVDQARRFAPVSKLAPRTPENWHPPQPTPPIALPEEKQAYIPPPPSMDPIRIGPLSFPRMESPLLEALKTAPIRPYTPFSSEVASQLCDLPTPVEQMTFSSALITAPDRPFTPHCETRNYNESSLPYMPVVDYSKLPTEIYKENAEQIRCLEQEVEQRLERRPSAFAQIRPVKPATPMQLRKTSYNDNKTQMNFPFTDDQVLQNPRPLVCLPQECLNAYESSCSVQQRSYTKESQTQQEMYLQNQSQERMRYAQQQQQQKIQFNRKKEENIQYHHHQQQENQSTKSISKTNQLPPPHPCARIPSSIRRVQSQNQSTVLSKPDPAGLHKADDIPGYQRKWFNLPSQRASITPEPHELKENVPLAFVAAPKEPSPTISKPIAISASNTYTTTIANPSTSQYNSCQNTYDSQNKTFPQMIRKQLAIEP
ncbi:PDZ and LIM domain protein Zasp-like, partial [Culicoides brevitarsis]|uniref:PDZ and LIM domain protein Zasp-like n=1 Tax=Culicoides brevitarsis TaxID=469753 RepID=UPI00307B9F92